MNSFCLCFPFLWLDPFCLFHIYSIFMTGFRQFFSMTMIPRWFHFFFFFDWIGFSTFSTSIPFLLLDSSRVFQCQFHFYEWNPPVFSHVDVIFMIEFRLWFLFLWMHSVHVFHFYECILSMFSIFVTAFCPCFPFLWIHSVRVFYFCVFHFYDCIPSVFSTSIPFLWLDSDSFFPCRFCFYDWIPLAFSTLIPFIFLFFLLIGFHTFSTLIQLLWLDSACFFFSNVDWVFMIGFRQCFLCWFHFCGWIPPVFSNVDSIFINGSHPCFPWNALL